MGRGENGVDDDITSADARNNDAFANACADDFSFVGNGANDVAITDAGADDTCTDAGSDACGNEYVNNE